MNSPISSRIYSRPELIVLFEMSETVSHCAFVRIIRSGPWERIAPKRLDRLVVT